MSKDSIFAWDTTAGNNSDIAGTDISGATGKVKDGDNALRSIMAQVAAGDVQRGSDIATASTLDFTAATTPALTHDLTGTVTVTAVTMTATHWRVCRAQGVFQLTASATLIVNGSTSTNYTTTAGDLLVFFGYGSSTVRVWTFTGGSTVVPSATTSAQGIVELATQTEAATLTDTSRAITSDGLFFLGGYTTTATAAGTTTLTVTSNYNQYFTGSTTQTVVLPVTSTLVLGRPFRIVNNSTGSVTVQSSGANTIAVIAAGGSAVFSCILTSGTTAASWDYRGGIILGVPVASTSGTSIDYTIPSWAKRVNVLFRDTSLSGTANILVQLGDSGGVETTGYLGAASLHVTTTAATAFTTGFGVIMGASAGVLQGALVLSITNAPNSWVASGVFSYSNAAATCTSAGSKSVSAGPVTTVRITTSNGTDTFDAGEVNVSWEG